MKKRNLALFVAIICLLFAGCSTTDSDASDSPDSTIEVELQTPSPTPSLGDDPSNNSDMNEVVSKENRQFGDIEVSLTEMSDGGKLANLNFSKESDAILTKNADGEYAAFLSLHGMPLQDEAFVVIPTLSFFTENDGTFAFAYDEDKTYGCTIKSGEAVYAFGEFQADRYEGISPDGSDYENIVAAMDSALEFIA